MMRTAPDPKVRLQEQGITLLTGLVLLAAISLLALVAASSMALQLRMAGNFEDGYLALQNSTVAVTQGEDFLYSVGHDSRLPGCLSNCFNPPLNSIIHQAVDFPPFPEYEDETWWRSWAVDSGFDPLSGAPAEISAGWNAANPRYLIEEVYFDPLNGVRFPPEAPPLSGIGYYRILGRGSGRGAATVSVSESIVARPWKADAVADSGKRNAAEFCAAFKAWYNCGRMAWRQRL